MEYALVGNLIVCDINEEGDEIGLTDEEIEVIMFHYIIGWPKDYPQPYPILLLD